ncbi:hypothetical protein GCM10025787_12120 [Saccharopolyspora rosea]
MLLPYPRRAVRKRAVTSTERENLVRVGVAVLACRLRADRRPTRQIAGCFVTTMTHDYGSADPEAARFAVDRPDHDTTVVAASGEVDAAAVPRLRELLDRICSDGTRTMVVDLSEVTFFGSDGLEWLCEAQQRAGARAMALCLVPGRQVDRLLHLVREEDRFRSFDSVPRALGAVRG